jgi:hypothetical protein
MNAINLVLIKVWTNKSQYNIFWNTVISCQLKYIHSTTHNLILIKKPCYANYSLIILVEYFKLLKPTHANTDAITVLMMKPSFSFYSGIIEVNPHINWLKEAAANIWASLKLGKTSLIHMKYQNQFNPDGNRICNIYIYGNHTKFWVVLPEPLFMYDFHTRRTGLYIHCTSCK